MIHSDTAKLSGLPRKRCLVCSLHLVSKLKLVWHTSSHIHMVYTIHQRFSSVFTLSGFLHWQVMSLHVTLSKQPADFVEGCMLVGKHVGSSVLFHYFRHTGHAWYPGYCSYLMLECQQCKLSPCIEICFGRSKPEDGKQICPQNIVCYNSTHMMEKVQSLWFQSWHYWAEII